MTPAKRKGVGLVINNKTFEKTLSVGLHCFFVGKLQTFRGQFQ